MSKRAQNITSEKLETVVSHHPYLNLFQKEDWREYLVLIAEIYDLLEDDSIRLPFEAVRTIALKFYASKQLLNLENKISNFFIMSIGELRVLQDSHDQFGNRFIETTRWGRQLLQLVESLLSQRTRYTGTGAETLLGSLNDILVSQQQLSLEQALTHHKEKIKSYQKDILRIQEKGLEYAELLPIPHSNKALFSQAEEAAIHIISSIEDVKIAIENQRQELSNQYFEGNKSAGQSLHAIADFYELLFHSQEYQSYLQAKNLLSHLEGYSARFALKNVELLIHRIRENELIPEQDINRSQLRSFMNQFSLADHSIAEKVKAQIKLLQQQVQYAINSDIQGLQKVLHSSISLLLSNKKNVIDFFKSTPIEITIPVEFENGSLQLFNFEIQSEPKSEELISEKLNLDEQKNLLLALLQAEETTLQNIIEKLRNHLYLQKTICLDTYSIDHGLAEYYVLSEVDLFDKAIVKTYLSNKDLPVKTKYGEFFLINVPIYTYTLQSEVPHEQ